jgi:hypothetical protein
VLVRGVDDDEVHHDADAAGVRLAEQLVDVGEGAEHRVDVVVVADVVPVVVLRRPVDRGEPHDPDAESREVVELADDSAEVTYAVAVGVGEAPRIDLVHRRRPPPAGRTPGEQANARQDRRVVPPQQPSRP